MGRTVSDITFEVPISHSSGHSLVIPENDTFTGKKKSQRPNRSPSKVQST